MPNGQTAVEIRIQISPLVNACQIHGRYDLLLIGQIFTSQPLAEVALHVGGERIGCLTYGSGAPSAAIAAPDADGWEYSARLNWPLLEELAAPTIECSIVARTQSGAIAQQTFQLSFDWTASPPVSVLEGPTQPAESRGRARSPVLFYIERAGADADGNLLVEGWAIGLTPISRVEAFAGETRVGKAQYGHERSDVGQAFPAYPDAQRSGFSLTARHPDGCPATVRLLASSRGGFTHEIVMPVERIGADTIRPEQPEAAAAQAAPNPHDESREFHCFCDDVTLTPSGHLHVSGWAICAAGLDGIAVYVDQDLAGEAETGLLREDVGSEYRHIPSARYSGFLLVAELGDIRPGSHRVRLLLRNTPGDSHSELRNVRVARPKPPKATVNSASPAPPAIDDNAGHFQLVIDHPTIVGGAAVGPIAERLAIEGWVVARSGIASIDVMLDDQRLGEAHYGLARQDVGAAFPDWPHASRSGFAVHCPQRSLRNGPHIVHLTVHAHNGQVLHHRFGIEVKKTAGVADGIDIQRRIRQTEIDVAQDLLAQYDHHPAFSLILLQKNALDRQAMQTTIASLRAQIYRTWSLQIVTCETDVARAVNNLLAESAADLRDRISVVPAIDTAALNTPLGRPDLPDHGCLVGFLSPGDELGGDALLQIALAGGLHRSADLLYADEIRTSPVSHEYEAFLKPDFSPDLLLSMNYIGRPWFATPALLEHTGATLRRLLAAGEYDALLRCTELATSIHHVPKVLCRRGAPNIDDRDQEFAALTEAAARRGVTAELLPGFAPDTWRLRRMSPVTGLVSIIIPTCAAQEQIKRCIKSLRERTTYRNVEIICVENIPPTHAATRNWLSTHADKVIHAPDKFNWSQFNNRGVDAASGEYLLFLNDDTEIIEPDWLDAMLEHARRTNVALVGPLLLYPNRKIQHAGMFLATHGSARHAFRFSGEDEPGYFGLALTQRNVIAVTGACMLMRRSVYQMLGGFDEAHEIINNDLDFCLRAHQAGLLTVYTPFAKLIHHESVSRGQLEDTYDLDQFHQRWKTLFAAGDPYFNPRLSHSSNDYRPEYEPTEAIFPGHPLYRHSDIKRILVVKVDHIGDFVTSMPAIRRLRQLFPAAKIHLLASQSVHHLATRLDCIDEFIAFDFFHAISSRGPLPIEAAEYEALRRQLATYRFDLAVDLRKHLDTREILTYTSARLLAGYDSMGQFPFLDIALQWEDDKSLQRKRTHVADDLLNLVEAIGTAGIRQQPVLARPAATDELPACLDTETRALFAKPVVAIHTGVGNVMRRWPAEHFASLADLLIEKNDVAVVLIGGGEEAELADAVLDQIIHRDAVRSLIGKTSLSDLPELLSACALYVGNNSGPKHIAAALGVPTIGIHSGVVDAVEWGPIGDRAVALRRDMACSPCYLTHPEDCPRNLACLRDLTPALVHEMAQMLLARPLGTDAVRPQREAVLDSTAADVARPATPRPLQRQRIRRAAVSAA